MDDLSFEDFETEYKYLKAVIEGGLEKKPDNVLIYATSNRRHLIREKFSDKQERDDELHSNDTVQEKLFPGLPLRRYDLFRLSGQGAVRADRKDACRAGRHQPAGGGAAFGGEQVGAVPRAGCPEERPSSLWIICREPCRKPAAGSRAGGTGSRMRRPGIRRRGRICRP